ncbi:hypothetical protein CAL29_06980 [Bordetella genomosp. 10]|uniref:N-terminal of MaoC-like dehydratase domain-containing protein n=1 Tax=Bordetella genomosp. 10 TaxID=1416804 RepID=A0A261SLY4_9BORD|nr:hypothetical protein [Bordetella genomosp. 10]OZI38081.1 hypothetical protein CAL29_06980 [Bordetella genomosp. 10]
MTRPSEIKPREGSVPGTPYAVFAEGAQLGPVSFDITPEIVQEYFSASQADPSLYVVDGRQAAAPNVILPYMTVPVYQTYPPIQGIVMAELEMNWHRPIWADETTRVTATGTIVGKFEKRGRKYVQWRGVFADDQGRPLAELLNTFHVPE